MAYPNERVKSKMVRLANLGRKVMAGLCFSKSIIPRFSFAHAILLSLLVVGCAKKALELPEVASSTISGQITGFSSSSSLSVHSKSDVSALSCSSPTASLYRLDSSGNRVEPALATTSVDNNGNYSFKSKEVGVTFQSSNPSDTVIVAISGCTSGVYFRPVTGPKNQNVTMGSTVISYLLNTNNKDKVAQAMKNSLSELGSLIDSLNSAATLEDAYTLLSSNSSLQTQFSNIFGVTPTTLNQASPEVVSSTLPATASELVAVHLAVSVSHFSSSYSTVYEWKLDTTVIGSQADWQWTPNANSQGAHTLTLTIGENNGSGAIDTTKPTKVVSKALTITNNVAPAAPTFSVTVPTITGTTPINTRSLTVTIDTGSSLANCASFSSLALTENSTTAPAPGAFTISCSQSPTQDLSYTLTTSGDGQKTLRLWAMDASGAISSVATNTSVYLDTGTPTISISTTPLALSNSNSQTFSFAASDNGGVIDHYECKMDSGSYATCSSPKSYSSLVEGDHTFSVKAFDTAGNVSNIDTKTWHIDLTAPTLTIAGSPNSINNQLTSTFTFSATDGGGGTVASYSCNLDSAGYSACASPKIDVLSSGAHTLLIKATDTAGNISSVQSFSWTIDTSLPTVSISSKPASLTNSTTASFSFTGSDTGGGSVASYECQIDSSGYSACTSPKSYTGLSASAHSFQVRAIDTATNTGTATSYSWTIDLTTPLASINSGPNSLTNSTSASFTFSANPPPAGSITGYECNLDNAGWASCSSPKAYTSLSQGNHNFEVRSIDNNNNRSSASSQTWIIDTTAPTLSINSNPTSLNNSTSASFSFSATDTNGVASYSCKLDSASYASCSSPISYSSLAQGSHTFYVTATDNAGNTSSAQTYTWTTDLTAPTITISANPNSVTNSTSASFSFSASDTGGGAVAGYQCSLDGAAYASCTSAKSYTGLAVGSHQFALIAIDTAGNTSAASTYSWTIDQTAPTISITSTPISPTNATTASFSFSATDSGGGAIASYACKVDSGSYASCTSPQSYSSLAAGAHTFYITSTDTAGNTSVAGSVNWTIDLTAPTVAISVPTASAVVPVASIASYAISGTCSENGQNVTIAGSISATASCSSGAWSTTIDISGLADGTLSITANQLDVAGNSTTTASRSFIKDTTAPTISVTTPSAMQGNVSTGSVSWTLTEANVAASTNFTVEIYNGSSWSSVGTKAANAGTNTNQAYTLSNFSVPNVDVTSAKIRVTITDAAGNSTTAQTGTFIIDSTAPTVSAFSINDGATYAGTSLVSIKMSVADNNSTGSQISVRVYAANASTGDCQSEYSNNNWVAWTDATTNIGYSIVPTDGTKKICGWAKDAVGNISVISPSAGTTGTNTSSIQYSTGNPPTISSFSVVKTSTGGYTASSGDALTITWSAADVEGLDNNPVNISYTTDNSTWKDLTTNLTIATAANRTWVGGLSGNPTSGSGTITTYTAPSSSYFKLKIQARDVAGNTSSVVTSQGFNTGSWSIYAGNKDRGDGGTGRSAVLSGEGSTSLFAINPTNGDIYASDNQKGIRKLDAKTGLVSTVITGTTSNLPTNGALPATPALPAGNYNNLVFDSKGRLYVGTAQSAGPATIIYQIDFANSWVRQYAGGGTGDDGGTAATSLQIASGGSFDEQDSLYVWSYCGGTVVNSTTSQTVGRRIIKILQNSDGTPGATSRIIGDCTFANPTSGNTAYSQPASMTPYPGVSSIIPWDNGNKILVNPYSTGLKYKIINGTVYSSNIGTAVGAGTGIYNPADGLIYRTTGSAIEKISINTSGANGDTATTVFSYNSSASGCSADGTAATSYCGLIGTNPQFRSGILYFADGAQINSISEFAVRYFDSSNQLRTVFGGQPFFGDGLDKSLMRGMFTGIYYKKSSESNQAAFPEGLYFMEKSGVVFGYINPSTGLVSHLWGNQARFSSTPVSGTTVSKNLTMGYPYFGGNGYPLMFDSSGLPWMRINNDAVSIDANNKIVRRTTQSSSSMLQVGANNVNPANYGLYVYGGYNNFAIKGSSGLFILPNYVYTGYDPIISIRYMDFANNITPIIIGGNYLASSNTAASADITTPGAVAAAPLYTSCRNGLNCFLNYQSGSDRLYFTENTKMRYITTPDNTATATLGTLFTLGSSSFANYSFTPDGSQLWYFKATGGLYCHDISSGKSWCDDTTDHFSIRTAAGFVVTTGANQITFKDNQTMFVSTYGGEILQFNLPTTP